MSPNFIHLKVHTEFSLNNGLVRIKPLAKRLVADQVPAIAITDQSNLCALVKVYKTMRGSGVKPIVGVDIWLENIDEPENPSRLTLLAKTDKGYRNMTELISKGFTEGQALGRAVIQRQWLEQAAEGLIALSGAKEGEIGRALVSGRKDQAADRLKHWMSVFPDSFYLELHERLGRMMKNVSMRVLNSPLKRVALLLRQMMFSF